MTHKLLTLTLLLSSMHALADDSASTSAEPTVEDNIVAMDTDHDGMVTIAEMRKYVQTKHGASYQSDVLKKMEAAADSRSCGSPFSSSFY